MGQAGPDTSTADTLTENLAPVLDFCSCMPLNSQDMAHGMIPYDCGSSGDPIIVYVLPVKKENNFGMMKIYDT